MKIIFWSEEKDCGTTSNMIAAASLLASKRPCKVALLQAGRHLKDLSGSFTGREENLVKEDCEYYALRGMDYLLTAGRDGRLTRKHLEGALQTLDKERLYCIPQGKHALSGYYPEQVRQILDQVIELTDEVMDFSFIDCGCEQDEWTREQMKQADLVVVNFRQSAQVLDHFFAKQPDIACKTIYFISSYQKDSIYNKKNINRIYRIAPEKLGVVPYNPEFQLACNLGRVDKYMKGKKTLLPTEMRDYFFAELERAVQILMESLEEDGKENHTETGAGREGQRTCESDFKKKSL